MSVSCPFLKYEKGQPTDKPKFYIMEFFKKLSESINSELTATIVVKMTASGKMTVCTHFTTATGSNSETLQPFILRGTPEEMDAGYLESINLPIEEVKGLISNLSEFQQSVNKAKKPIPTTSATLTKKKEEDEKKKANLEKALNLAKEANIRGRYYEAEKLLELSNSLTDDKKVKAEIAKQLKAVQEQKGGLLCSDNEESAAEALSRFMEESKAATKSEPEKETAPVDTAEMENLEENDGEDELENS